MILLFFLQILIEIYEIQARNFSSNIDIKSSIHDQDLDVHKPIIKEIRVEPLINDYKVDYDDNIQSLDKIINEKLVTTLPENSKEVCNLNTENKENSTEESILNTENCTDDFGDSIEKCYIVKTKSSDITKNQELISFLKSNNIKPTKTYSKLFGGFTFCTKNPNISKKIKYLSIVSEIEPDLEYKINSVQSTIPFYMFLMNNLDNTIFKNYIINNRLFDLLGINTIFNYLFGSYTYNFTGKNIEIYVLDTTVDINDSEIKGRVSNLFKNDLCNTHGTNVAKVIGGKNMGFAKDSNLKILNVVNCSGIVKLSEIISGLEKIPKNLKKPTVLYLSINGPKSNLFNRIISKITENNVIVVSAAGNNHDIACNYSPGSSENVINVGSINQDGDISKFSNFGGCIRIFALGEEIDSNSNLGNKLMGTSFSAAIVTGAVAIYLEKFPNATQTEIWNYLNSNSIWNKNGYLALKIPQLDKETDSIESTKNIIPNQSTYSFKTMCLKYYFIGITIPIICITFLILIILYFIRRHRTRKEIII
ncbi:hypothetical protein LUQ84_001183 [Hamiltosporidium tvaerminnensis]|nr:hypothetical protein LUQ84_001183 [Hamiltosporidium tvaerminnensis]